MHCSWWRYITRLHALTIVKYIGIQIVSVKQYNETFCRIDENGRNLLSNFVMNFVSCCVTNQDKFPLDVTFHPWATFSCTFPFLPYFSLGMSYEFTYLDWELRWALSDLPSRDKHPNLVSLIVFQNCDSVYINTAGGFEVLGSAGVGFMFIGTSTALPSYWWSLWSLSSMWYRYGFNVSMFICISNYLRHSVSMDDLFALICL